MQTIFKHSWLLLAKPFLPETKLKFFELIFSEPLANEQIEDQHLKSVIDFIRAEISEMKRVEEKNLANLALLENAKNQKRVEAGRKGGLAKASKILANSSKPSNARSARNATNQGQVEPSIESRDSNCELANLAMLEVLEMPENENLKVPPLSPPVPPLSLSHTLSLSPPLTPPNLPLKTAYMGVQESKKTDEVKRFKKPTIAEIEGYCKEKGLELVNAEDFFDYYESKGWKVGKEPMKDWQSAARRWERQQKERQAGQKQAFGKPKSGPMSTKINDQDFSVDAWLRNPAYIGLTLAGKYYNDGSLCEKN